MTGVKGKLITGVFLLCVVLAGCSSTSRQGEEPTAKTGWVGYTESGIASYYADKHQHRRTASGEPYQHEQLTAAHRKLPFGSQVKVTNVDNGKTVTVKINDRGPFVRGRIIDLSKSAFSRLGSTALGLLDVTIEVIR